MIIFRCNLVAFIGIVLLASACSKEIAEPVQDVRTSEGIEIQKSGKPFNHLKFMDDYRANPNSFNLTDLDASFTVSGFVKEVSLFDPQKEMLDKLDPDRPKPSYYIPLQSEDPTFDSLITNDVDVSIWMKNFSREKASELKVGKKFVVICDRMRVVNGTSITFDDCEKQKAEQTS